MKSCARNICFIVLICIVIAGCKRLAPGQGTTIDPPGTTSFRLIAQYYIGAHISEPSGIVYNALHNSFYIVSDAHTDLYETDLHGTLIHSIPTTSTDLEGISLSANDDTIFVVEERNKLVVTYRTDGTRLSQFSADVATATNNALEGVTVDRNRHLFVLNEKLPGMLLEYLPNGTEIKRTTLSLALDYSDIFYDAGEDCLWMISDESKKIMKMTKNGGLITEWPVPFTKGEGISIVRDTIYVVNDADATLYLFTKPK